MVVTPDVAERWLNESNSHNRPLRNNLVQRYAAAIKRGEWKLTAEPIAFCGPYNDECNEPQGVTLINGQHRLWAIVEAQIGVEMTVWWGCEPDEFSVIDQNAPRTLGDVLSTTRKDLQDSTLIASICSTSARFAFGFSSHANGACGSIKLRPAQVSEMLAFIEPEIVAVAEYKKQLRTMAPRAVVGALLLARIVNESKCDLVVAAWGGDGAYQERAKAVVALLSKFPLVCLGRNSDGSPRHPLYVAGDTKLEPFSL